MFILKEQKKRQNAKLFLISKTRSCLTGKVFKSVRMEAFHEFEVTYLMCVCVCCVYLVLYVYMYVSKTGPAKHQDRDYFPTVWLAQHASLLDKATQSCPGIHDTPARL